MTQISGKIYQMWNAAGTEKRFPRTVIEAVYGLSSYLQQQFASLADIYMPIGGISEALAGQEFVYRISPNTIKAKSLTLDRILGKSLAWNQLMENGNFATPWGGTMSSSVSNGIQTSVSVASNRNYITKTANIVSGHIYYAAFSYISNKEVSIQFAGNYTAPNAPVSSNWNRKSYIYSPRSSDQGCYLYNYSTLTAGEWTLKVQNYVLIDLTLMFGAGNEPSTVAEFEAMFPLPYYTYTPGSLISNDASALETEGFNKWDEEWEVGSLDNNGNNVSGNSIRAKNFCPAFSNTQYFVNDPATLYVIYFYDTNKQMIPYTGAGAYMNGYNGGAQLFTTPAGTAYFRFRTATTYGSTYNHDICINLSDATRNGQYEPYWKRIVQLGLNSFKVKDGQGNVITINGLKSAGSVYDEIVGNKYVKRVGEATVQKTGFAVWGSAYYKTGALPTACATQSGAIQANAVSNRLIVTYANNLYGTDRPGMFAINGQSIYISATDYNNSALTAFDIYYELATPIEYELVEPLVPTVKAGTTEARISPNADGLSAPFRADMTYSAQENNDSASSQYAAVAGRLLNPQTIWGQTFDGSSPVTGALTGVTTINGTAIQINSSGNVGIGTAATTAKLKVNGEINCGGITCGGEAIFTEGIELDSTASYKIWYDDDYNRIVFTVPNGDYLYSTGGIVSASYITAGASSSSSDAKLKDNIASVTTERALSIFSALSGREWDWNDKMTAFEGQHCSGLVAQEVQKVMPWAVLDYNDTLSLNYNCLWGIAIPVIQNLMHRVEELESKLNN